MTSTSKKGVRVGWFEYQPANIKLPIHYNDTTLQFSIIYAETAYTDQAQQPLMERVKATIIDSLGLEWLPIIEVRPAVSPSLRVDAVFGFELSRRYVAQFPDGSYKYATWESPDRLAGSHTFEWSEARDGTFHPPCLRARHGQDMLFLPYTETGWTHLRTFQDRVRLARNRFFARLATQEGLTVLFDEKQSLCELLELEGEQR